MSREAIDLAYSLFSRGDREGFVAMFTPDAVVHASGVLPGMDEEYRGQDGLRRWWAVLRESWDTFELTHKIEAVDGDRYLIDVEVHGRGASSGVEVRQQVWHVVDVEGTRTREHWSFWEHAPALAKLQERKTERPG